jgi:hypothetical protein
MTTCFNLRRTEKVEDPESLTFINGILNIDTQSRKGLSQARSANLIESGLVDVIVSSYFLEGILLFKPHHQGRAFTILQHPVARTERLYFYHKSSKLEFEGLSMLDYLQSDVYKDNWIVRSLINVKAGELNEDHLSVARGILARKFLVGISEYLSETIKRLRQYYKWIESKDGCVDYFLNNMHNEKETHLTRGSEEWKAVADNNRYDMELYYYGLELFAKQASTMFGRPYVDKEGKPINFAKLKEQKMIEHTLDIGT